jgi:sarcosine oxidase
VSHRDVIVLGLGGMGSAAAAHLARRGARVLGLEQFPLVHDRGSSHGESRLIRRAYFESPRYVPLLDRAYALWDDLASELDEAPLLHRVGLALCSRDDGGASTATRALTTAALAGVPVEQLGAAEVRRRFPALRVPDGWTCLYEPSAGFLEVERCVAAHLEVARRAGAELRQREAVLHWHANARGVEVATERARYTADALVIAAGAWSAAALAELRLPLRVHRVWQFWFAAGPAMTAARGTPCYAFDVDGRFFYGFPRSEPWGCKICEHAPGAELAPGRLSEPGAAPSAAELEPVAAAIAAYLPEVSPAPAHHKSCFYTMTPDADFLVDRHPEHAQVQLAAGFSGHGFKFASAIGELLADRVAGLARPDAEFLRLRWP